MVSRSVVVLVAVAIVMLVVGTGIGYGIAGTRVATITATATLFTPVTRTTTVRETETMFTPIPTTITLFTPVTKITTVTVTVAATPTPTVRVVEAVLRQVVQVGSWRLAVVDVKEVSYVKTLKFGVWSYYKAPEGMKIVIATLKVENVGMEIRSPFGFAELSLPLLVTATNRSYGKAYTYELESIYEITKDIEREAAEYRELDVLTKLAPGSYVEGDVMFLIPQGEKPAKLVLEYWPSPFEPKTVVVVKLS